MAGPITFQLGADAVLGQTTPLPTEEIIRYRLSVGVASWDYRQFVVGRPPTESFVLPPAKGGALGARDREEHLPRRPLSMSAGSMPTTVVMAIAPQARGR